MARTEGATDGGGTSTSYRLLPVQLTGHGGGPAVTRYLYVKQHASAADGLPKERALFIAGIPAAFQGPPLVELFARFGEVERAALHGSGVSAVLLYHAAEGLAALLKAAAKGRPLEIRLPEPQGPCGLKAWVEEHKALKPGNGELQAALDEWMEEWEAEEEHKRQEALKAQEDDGWTVVQRHKGRKKNASTTGVVVGGVAGAAAAAQLAAAKQKDPSHSDFYRFQQREQRRNELLDLRAKFEQDKKRIAELRASRKWKPY